MTLLREILHRLIHLAVLTAAGLVGRLRLDTAVSLGERLAALYGRLARPAHAMAVRHARRLGVEEARLRSHVDAVFRGYGRYWAEALWLRPSNRHSVEAGITHDGLEHVLRARDAGHGMIYVLPHIGNWEFAGPLAASIGVDVVAVAENLANRRLREWFVDLRKRLGIQVVLATGRSQVMRDLDAAIARNAAVALVSDRDLRGKGVRVTFFGEETTLPAGPASLAIRTGAPILPVAAYFRPDGGHHIVIRPAVPVDRTNEDRGKEVQTVTQRIADELEGLIRAEPEQWHLLQPNWPSDRS